MKNILKSLYHENKRQGIAVTELIDGSTDAIKSYVLASLVQLHSQILASNELVHETPQNEYQKDDGEHGKLSQSARKAVPGNPFF